MKEYYYSALVITDENGTRADFDPVYSPPLVHSAVVGGVIPEGATVVVIAVSPSGLSDDMAAQVVTYWNDAFTYIGEKELGAVVEEAPISRKAPLPSVKATGEDNVVYLERVLAAVTEAAVVEVARLEKASVPLVDEKLVVEDIIGLGEKL
jgi:hypothetical protein